MTITMPKCHTDAITYEMLGGGKISGRTAKELAHALRNSSFSPKDSLKEFIMDVAENCRIYRPEACIRTDSHEHFIADLVTNGFLTEPSSKPSNVIDFPSDPDEESEK